MVLVVAPRWLWALARLTPVVVWSDPSLRRGATFYVRVRGSNCVTEGRVVIPRTTRQRCNCPVWTLTTTCFCLSPLVVPQQSQLKAMLQFFIAALGICLESPTAQNIYKRRELCVCSIQLCILGRVAEINHNCMRARAHRAHCLCVVVGRE